MEADPASTMAMDCSMEVTALMEVLEVTPVEDFLQVTTLDTVLEEAVSTPDITPDTALEAVDSTREDTIPVTALAEAVSTLDTTPEAATSTLDTPAEAMEAITTLDSILDIPVETAIQTASATV